MDHVDVTVGLNREGWIVINSPSSPRSFPLSENWNVATVDATTIAAAHGIGTQTAPIVNTTLLGALVRVMGIVGLQDLEQAIAETIPKRAEPNQEATREAYEKVMMSTASGNRVPTVS
jgi:Pyruvate/2-oxoacid:ferredoxin oxidoreductase gamma subunit